MLQKLMRTKGVDRIEVQEMAAKKHHCHAHMQFAQTILLEQGSCHNFRSDSSVLIFH